jgi:membrane-associated phospholipid phosphatase
LYRSQDVTVDALNLYLFHAIAAGFDPHPLLLPLASLVSSLSGWACLVFLSWVAWCRPTEVAHVLTALALGAAISLLARDMAATLGFPRPFMLGLSPLHAPHGMRAGLPSTHASVMFTIAFMVLLRRPLRDVGWALIGAAALTGWSRIYLGIHFPADIAAGMMLATAATAVGFMCMRVLRALKVRQPS